MAAEGRARSFDKSNFKKQIDGRGAKKVLQKVDFSLYFFNNIAFIKTSNPALCRQKEFVLNLKVVHKWHSLINPFPANHCLAFSYSGFFSWALYSDDFS